MSQSASAIRHIPTPVDVTPSTQPTLVNPDLFKETLKERLDLMTGIAVLSMGTTKSKRWIAKFFELDGPAEVGRFRAIGSEWFQAQMRDVEAAGTLELRPE